MSKIYQVEVSSKYPAWNETPGLVEVVAANAKEAISKARKQMAREGNISRQDGPTIYRIKRHDE
jgi:hypothetical protein